MSRKRLSDLLCFVSCPMFVLIIVTVGGCTDSQQDQQIMNSLNCGGCTDNCATINNADGVLRECKDKEGTTIQTVTVDGHTYTGPADCVCECDSPPNNFCKVSASLVPNVGSSLPEGWEEVQP